MRSESWWGVSLAKARTTRWTKRPFERFRDKIAELRCGPMPTPCWIWGGGLSGKGYASFWGNGHRGYGHRWAYEFLRGPVASGLEIDHLCRVHACVNPFHMEAVTRRTNQRRGNSVSGINHRKKACIRGHPFSPQNVMVKKRGHDCKVCHRDRERARVRAKRAACQTA